MKTAASAAIIMIALSGCSLERAETAEKAKRELVGTSSQALLACAGRPNEVIHDGDLQFWNYRTGGRDYDYLLARKPNEVERLLGTDTKRSCQATILIRNGIVQSVRYSGNTGGLATQYEACAQLVDRCVEN